MTTVTLRIINPVARPTEIEFNVDLSAVSEIITWYSAYSAGDPYKVLVNGTEQELDYNGHIYGGPRT